MVVLMDIEWLCFCFNKDVFYNNLCCLIFIDVNGDVFYIVKIVCYIVMEFVIFEFFNVFFFCIFFVIFFIYI